MEEIAVQSGSDDLFATYINGILSITVTEVGVDVAQICFMQDEAKRLGQWLIQMSER